MPKLRRGTNSSANNSRLPLEILLPVSVSILLSLAMAVVLIHRARRKKAAVSEHFAASPSLLVLSDPEANRQWLADLSCLKELGLGRLKKVKRACSLRLEVKCRGLSYFNNGSSHFGLPTRPQSAFFPEGRRGPTPHAIVRRSWIRNVFRSSHDDRLGGSCPNTRDNEQAIPEIRITVPSTAADEATSPLPQDRRWSRIIAHDMRLARDSASNFKIPDDITKQVSTASSTTKTHRFRHPPNGMDTLPSPAQRRLSCIPPSDLEQSYDLHLPTGTLSPIRETRETLSLSSTFSSVSTVLGADDCESAATIQLSGTQGTLMSSYGFVLLRTSSSSCSAGSGSSEVQNSGDSSYSQSSEGIAFHTTSAVGSTHHVNPSSSDQLLAVQPQPQLSPIPSTGSSDTAPVAISPSEPFDSGQIPLSDMSAEFPATVSGWTSQARRFFVCNPDTPDLCSSSTASLPTATLALTCGSLPMPLIPSTFVDAPPTPSLSSMSASMTSKRCPNLDEPTSSRDSLPATGMKPHESSVGLAGVESWVDDEMDQFFCPGPTKAHR